LVLPGAFLLRGALSLLLGGALSLLGGALSSPLGGALPLRGVAITSRGTVSPWGVIRP
jgi:hypothetical protein